MTETVQRREERTEVDWIAVMRLADGTEVPCAVKDISPAGMKVAIRADQALPETFALKIVGRDLVFRVRLAWRRHHHVGVLIEKIAKLPGPQDAAPVPAPAPASEHARIGSRERYRTNF